MATIPEEPHTNLEQYLNRIATGEGEIPAEPHTNVEQYLNYIIENGTGGGGGEARVVDELPAEGETGYIYLILKESTKAGDIYDEYIWALQQDGTTYGWEHLGATNEVTLEIDDAMSDTSENAVQNKVIKTYVDGKVPNVVQSTGTSTTNVMSQKAVTDMIFDGNNTSRIRIGSNSSIGLQSVVIGSGASTNAVNSQGDVVIGPAAGTASDGAVAIGRGAKAGPTSYSYTATAIAIGQYATASSGGSIALGGGFDSTTTKATASGGSSIAIGSPATASGTRSMALGHGASAPYANSVAIGNNATTTLAGEVNIGAGGSGRGYNSSNYRLLSGVYDPQSDHDAATKGYVDTAVASAAQAYSTSSFNNLWENA